MWCPTPDAFSQSLTSINQNTWGKKFLILHMHSLFSHKALGIEVNLAPETDHAGSPSQSSLTTDLTSICSWDKAPHLQEQITQQEGDEICEILSLGENSQTGVSR